MKFVTLVCGLLLCAGVEAHHSRANYDMQTFLEYDAIVVEFMWSNPHAFVVVEILNEANQPSRLLLEMNSKPILTGMGWSADSIAVGDRIQVRGNPDRRADRKQLFVRYLINPDGEKLWSFGRTREDREAFEASNPVVRKPLIGSTDFSGIWNRARLTDAQRSQRDNLKFPLTTKGEAAFLEYDANNDPAFECLPKTPPRTIISAYLTKFERVSDELLTISYEFNNGYREIHMGRTAFPADVELSPMGYSIGRIEDDELIIHTKYFSYDRWGNDKGVPSGESKEVFERYWLTNDGKRLEVSYATIDPEYLQGPKIPIRGAWVLRNNIEFTDWQCDPDAAIRHLTGE